MGHGADLGTELAADRALIELLTARCEAERDAARRQALVKRLAVAVEDHLAVAFSCLTDAVREYVPDRTELCRCGERARDQVASALARVAGPNEQNETGIGLVHDLATRSRGLLDTEHRRLLPALEQAVTWHVLEDLGEKVRAGRQTAWTAHGGAGHGRGLP